jgi:F-box domain
MDRSSLPFPNELLEHIFAYLDISDVSRFCCSSRPCFDAVVPELWRRRQRMKVKVAYKRNRKLPCNYSSEAAQLWVDASGVDVHPRGEEWIMLASVEERISQLSRTMPVEHTLYKPITDLRKELCMAPPSFHHGSSFDALLLLLRMAVQPLKLYAFILAQAFHSDPMIGDSHATTLDQYLGDVLILAYLLNLNEFGLVEGAPRNSEYYCLLREGRLIESPSSSYRAWVHIHSSILRTKTFTKDQSERLGVPFEDSFSMLSEMVPNDCCYINEHFLSSEMRLVSYDFGPLGSRFRGRDVLNIRDTSARCLVAFFLSGEQRQGTTARSALDWLYLLHQEARKSRPMTVRPPIISLCRPSPG